jgi:predicted nuclease of predicted toxin-antitoxin system
MFLIDQNLSPSLVWRLKSHFEGLKHVRDLGLSASSDLDIWEFAKSKSMSILTKDNDFRQILGYKGFPPKVIQLEMGNCSTKEVIQRMVEEKSDIYDFLISDRFGLLEIKD